MAQGIIMELFPVHLFILFRSTIHNIYKWLSSDLSQAYATWGCGSRLKTSAILSKSSKHSRECIILSIYGEAGNSPISFPNYKNYIVLCLVQCSWRLWFIHSSTNCEIQIPAYQMGVIFLLYLTSKPTVRTNFHPSIILYHRIELFCNAGVAFDLSQSLRECPPKCWWSWFRLTQESNQPCLCHRLRLESCLV